MHRFMFNCVLLARRHQHANSREVKGLRIRVSTYQQVELRIAYIDNVPATRERMLHQNSHYKVRVGNLVTSRNKGVFTSLQGSSSA